MPGGRGPISYVGHPYVKTIHIDPDVGIGGVVKCVYVLYMRNLAAISLSSPNWIDLNIPDN